MSQAFNEYQRGEALLATDEEKILRLMSALLARSGSPVVKGSPQPTGALELPAIGSQGIMSKVLSQLRGVGA